MHAALRALARRDLTAAEVDRRLARSGFAEEERASTLERLRRDGYVDDGRAARERARALSDRGLGDAAVRHDLAGRGVASGLIDEVVAALEPEAVRAVRVARGAGGGVRAGRALARKGFAADAVEHALGAVADEVRSGVG